MAKLVWDKVGERIYETGLDKGVLFLPDGHGVPWNGLTSVIEKFDKETTPIYYDGMKINDLVTLGSFEATMKAVTYPDEFVEIEGTSYLRYGSFLNDQKVQVFGLCYRTQVGNDLEGDTSGYKIHIIYNVTAIPNEKTYASVSADPSLVEFEWNIVAVPEEFPGFRPTAHITIDSRDFDPWLMEELEEKLYGGIFVEAMLIPMPDLIAFIKDWFRLKIIDNGDGTWTAISKRAELIQYEDVAREIFTLYQANVIYIDEGTYIITDTNDIKDIPLIKIYDNGDGTWTATTDQDGLFFIDPDTKWFQISNATVVWVATDIYRISNTEE